MVPCVTNAARLVALVGPTLKAARIHILKGPLGPSRPEVHLEGPDGSRQGECEPVRAWVVTIWSPTVPEPDLGTESRQPRWTANAPLARVFFFGWILLQIAVPLGRRTLDHHPTRFGWEMFSSIRFTPRIEVEHHDGSRTNVPMSRYTGALRMEIEYLAVDWGPVCADIPTARNLRLTRPRGVVLTSWECSPP